MKTTGLVVCGWAVLWLPVVAVGQSEAPKKNAGALPAVVVTDFEIDAKKGDLRGELLSDLISTGLSESSPIVDRKQLKKVLTEQALSLSGLVDAAQAVRTGKLVGAKLLIAGKVFRQKDKAVVVVRVVSVETSRFKGLTIVAPGDLDVKTLADRTVRELVKKLPDVATELTATETGDPNSMGQTPSPKLPSSLATVAVLNFANLGQGDSTWDWLGKGLADLTIGDLASQQMRVVSREQMQEIVNEWTLKNQQDPKSIAGALKAVRCVHGTYHIAGGEAKLHASILDVTTGLPLHQASVAGPEGEILSLQKTLAAELADVLSGNSAGTLDAAKLPRWTENLKASQLLYQGVNLFDQGKYLEAWGLFRRALRQDDKFADARYWSGRMMYYVQEYHQSRLDLEKFAVEHPKHQRVGDAVMELIDATQLAAANADDVLRTLALVAKLSPQGAVHNQFGPGNSSTVGLYSAGLAAQILSSQARYREAHAWYGKQIVAIDVNHPLYWIAWREMFNLKIKQLRDTGAWLDMPPPPRPEWLGKDKEELQRYLDRANEAHPDWSGWSTTLYGGDRNGITIPADMPQRHEFFRMTPENPTVEIDFGKTPLLPRLHDVTRPYFWGNTFTRHFCADPDHFLTGLDVEVRYRPDSSKKFALQLYGDVVTPFAVLDGSGVWSTRIDLQPGTRTAALRLALDLLSEGVTRTSKTNFAILSWKVTARTVRCDVPSGAVILRTPDDMKFQAKLDGVALGEVDIARRVENVRAGEHVLRFQPKIWGPNRESEITFSIEPGQVVEIALSAEIDPRRRGPRKEEKQLRRINTPCDAHCFGPQMGDDVGKEAGDVAFFRARDGRWIVVWSMLRDLYLTISNDDGKTWSYTTRLPPPVNSANNERSPQLMQDEDGRYVLTFTSDRNLARSQLLYACWSDDLVNFSAPVLVCPEPTKASRLLQHADGSFAIYIDILGETYYKTGRKSGILGWARCTSKDLVTWSAPEKLTFPVAKGPSQVAGQRDFSIDRDRIVCLSNSQWSRLHMQVSDDGVKFPAPVEIVANILSKPGLSFRTFVQRDEQGVLLMSGSGHILRLRDGEWTRLGKSSFSWSSSADFTVSGKTAYSFLLPYFNNARDDNRGIRLGLTDRQKMLPAGMSLGYPLLMDRWELGTPPLAAGDPNFDALPTKVEARILKREPAKAPPRGK